MPLCLHDLPKDVGARRCLVARLCLNGVHALKSDDAHPLRGVRRSEAA
jgi:hypothetical protein